jgi:transposase
MVVDGQSEIMSMAQPILPEAIWEIIKPLLPTEKPAGTRGRPQVSNRHALQSILFVLKTGIP